MNFLGHIYLSNGNYELMLNNLYGDFVKGKDLSHYSKSIQKGITLHRKIDSYIDNHNEVLDLKHSLQEELPKIGGIAIDLYFDHLLAKNWENFHPTPLLEFTTAFYEHIPSDLSAYNDQFRLLISKMIEKNWLWQYQKISGLHKACMGVSGRISFPNKLQNGIEVFKKNEARIEETFENYMKDAQREFEISYQ